VWLVIIPILVPIFIAVAKFFIPKIPSVAIPIIAPIMGALVDWLTTGTFGQGTIMGAIAGSAGVGLREIVDQLRKNNLPAAAPGTQPPVK
jgi:ABC-type thiamin/hydroxymethylpyrimidine transport system permease subunit